MSQCRPPVSLSEARRHLKMNLSILEMLKGNTEPEDLIVASSWGVGNKVKRALACTIFQLRVMQAPLIVLPKGHPASPRLKVVVSIGERTRCSCQIQPGTHPEQDVLCACQEFHQIEIIGRPGGAEILGLAEEESNIAVQKFS